MIENAPKATNGFVKESITPKPPREGLAVVAYTIPLAETAAPPSEVILPPTVAVVVVTFVAATFNTVASIAEPGVVKVLSAP